MSNSQTALVLLIGIVNGLGVVPAPSRLLVVR